MVVAIQECDHLIGIERRTVNRVNRRSRPPPMPWCTTAAIASPINGFHAEAPIRVDGKQADERHRHDSGPEGEPFVGQDVVRTAQQHAAGRRRSAQSEECGQIPADQQRTQAPVCRSANEDERNRQNQRTHRDDPEIDSAERVQNVVVARAVRNRHLADRDSSAARSSTDTSTTATPAIAIDGEDDCSQQNSAYRGVVFLDLRAHRDRESPTPAPEWQTILRRTAA